MVTFRNEKKYRFTINSFFFREFIFWFGIKYLYVLIGNEIIVFIIIDSIIFLLIFKSFSLIKNIFFSKVQQYEINYIFFPLCCFFHLLKDFIQYIDNY